MERTQAATTGNSSLKSAIIKLQGLSNESQEAIASIINRLANAEGVSISDNHKLPIENISHWLTKLRSERKSERTIRLYAYLAERFLKQLPSPTRADIRKYLFSGYATRLMLEESEVMTSVLLGLMGLGVPALPVHDSVIVPARHGEAVRRVMEEEYRRHTGFEIAVA